MKTMSLAAAQTHWTASALSEGPVLLLRKGYLLCRALVGLSEQFDREAFTLGRNERLRQLVDEACRKTRRGRGIPFSEILAEVEKNPSAHQGQAGSTARKDFLTRIFVHAAREAGLRLRTWDDVRRGHALTGTTRTSWRPASTGSPLGSRPRPRRSPQQAAEVCLTSLPYSTAQPRASACWLTSAD